ncbi:MAG: class I SAM-dependent methyltransferase [Myxococcales bacterium FL481]|nr:MAG: class I SAM-dependent methyltransferase [Myxococcales bacterium FL481]
MTTQTDNRSYYDAFSVGYDDDRETGYHQLIDDQAAALVQRVGTARSVLEVGCGTGLILQRVAAFARRAQGIDLSPAMLQHARARGLDVQHASATDLPFPDASFDVAYSFKVLAHVPDFALALTEMARVVRPGGYLVFDIYNRHSIRYAIKRWWGPRPTSSSYDEAAIGTRFLSVDEAPRYFPAGTRLVDRAGIRVVTVHPAPLRWPGAKALLARAEWKLMDSRWSRFAGFVVFFLEKIT